MVAQRPTVVQRLVPSLVKAHGRSIPNTLCPFQSMWVKPASVILNGPTHASNIQQLQYYISVFFGSIQYSTSVRSEASDSSQLNV